MKTEAELGVMYPQAMKCLESHEDGKGKAGFFSRGVHGRVVLLTP